MSTLGELDDDTLADVSSCCPANSRLAATTMPAPAFAYPPAQSAMSRDQTEIFAARCIIVSRSEENKPDDAKDNSGQDDADDQYQKDAGPRFGLSRLGRRLNDLAVFFCSHPTSSRCAVPTPTASNRLGSRSVTERNAPEGCCSHYHWRDHHD